MQSQTQGTFCPICHEEYDKKESIPLILPQCGHTVCSKCLKTLLAKPQYSKCPYDNSPFPKGIKKVEDFKVNFGLRDFLVEETQWELCPVHQEKLRLLCCTDKVKICDDCVHFGDHKGHDVKNIKQVIPELKKKREKIDDTLKEYYDSFTESTNLRTKTKANLVEIIKGRFAELKMILNDKESEFIGQINSLFRHQDNILNNIHKGESGLKKELSSLAKSYADPYQSTDIFSLIDQGVEAITSKFNPKLLVNSTTELKNNLEGIFTRINNVLVQKREEFFDLELPTTALNSASTSFLELNGYKRPENEPAENLHKVKSRLIVTRQEGLLEIVVAQQDPQEITLDLQNLGLAEKLKLVVTNNAGIKGNKIEGDTAIILDILKKIKKLTDIEIIVNHKSPSPSLFSQILPRIFLRPGEVKTLKLSLQGLQSISKPHVDMIANTFNRLTSLQSLGLDLGEASCEQNFIKTIYSAVATRLPTLENFNLSLQACKVNQVNLQLLFVEMPNIKSFCLNLMNTKIIDRQLDNLSTISLPSMKKLESFALFVSSTKLSDEALVPLFPHLKNIKELALAFNGTKITNATLEALGRSLPDMVKSLQDFVLLLDGTAITSQGLLSVCTEMENLKDFFLNLDNTVISDEFLHAFANTTLPSMKNIKNFGISLAGTQVSDEGALRLLNALGTELTGLTLNLNGTRVSENVGEVLVRKLTGSFQALKSLEIGLARTGMSPMALEMVSELRKSIIRRGNES